MPMLFTYSLRNMRARKLTTVLTAGGMALVIFVFAAVRMLDTGLQQTLVSTGEESNAIFVRHSAEVEIQSIIDRQQIAIIENIPEIMIGTDGLPLISKEAVVLISLPKNGTGQTHNILVRGLGNKALTVHSQARLTEGRMFRPGSNEIVVGSALQGHFQGLEIGENVHFGQRNWLVVGRIDAGGSGFDSEIWLDSEQLMQTFRRNAYSSVVVRLSDAADLDQVKSRIEGDPRLTLEVKSERSFYEDQSRVLSGFIRFLGITLSFLFSLGAIIGATITMYGSIASRKSEIGVMRALGFRRRNILFAFLTESMLLGLLGWLAGMGLASLMMRVKITTLNWTSYSELAFQFMLTPTIVLQSLVFSLMMGLIGGFLPAFKAANLNIVAALRAH